MNSKFVLFYSCNPSAQADSDKTACRDAHMDTDMTVNTIPGSIKT